MQLSADSIDRVIRKAQKALPERAWSEVEPTVEVIRRYASGEGHDDDGAELAYQLGLAMMRGQMRAGGGTSVLALPAFAKASNLLMSLINLRAPGASDVNRAAAVEFAVPTAWDRLVDEE
jgi:hypothetical protein